MGGCEKTVILEASNGIKVGVIGLGEREWWVLDVLLSLEFPVVDTENAGWVLSTPYLRI